MVSGPIGVFLHTRYVTLQQKGRCCLLHLDELSAGAAGCTKCCSIMLVCMLSFLCDYTDFTIAASSSMFESDGKLDGGLQWGGFASPVPAKAADAGHLCRRCRRACVGSRQQKLCGCPQGVLAVKQYATSHHSFSGKLDQLPYGDCIRVLMFVHHLKCCCCHYYTPYSLISMRAQSCKQ